MVKVLPKPVTPSSTWLRSGSSTPATNSVIACGWSPRGSYSAMRSKATPPSDFSGRGGRCGINVGMLPQTRGWLASIGCRASTSRARCERSCGRASKALRLAVMSNTARAEGLVWRSAGRMGFAVSEPAAEPLALAAAIAPTASPPRSWCAGAGAGTREPLAARLVVGVPLTPSTGGAGGLPDLPREGRGRGVVSFGGRGINPDIGFTGSEWQPRIGGAQGLLTRAHQHGPHGIGRAGKVWHTPDHRGRRGSWRGRTGATPTTAPNRACEPRLAGSSHGLPVAVLAASHSRSQPGLVVVAGHLYQCLSLVTRLENPRRPSTPTAFQTPGSNPSHRCSISQGSRRSPYRWPGLPMDWPQGPATSSVAKAPSKAKLMSKTHNVFAHCGWLKEGS